MEKLDLVLDDCAPELEILPSEQSAVTGTVGSAGTISCASTPGACFSSASTAGSSG
ncbi:thiocillin family RiPP [Streptomyces sp. ZAF1911]|uniref:thiocillin family RiPP n=1 Tax=unclassified Streptomyces TaxID=2593676 RepID=UPI00237ADF90|nr:thiocillin family RiPP [Streptomyces sp. ZAF1911]MDD9375799.1 thiocillin family RiPP [Streptomyces sp. ZAF1911]